LGHYLMGSLRDAKLLVVPAMEFAIRIKKTPVRPGRKFSRKQMKSRGN